MNPIIKQAVLFTDIYKKYFNDPIEIREAMCFKAQYPALLPDIRDGDMYAGHITERGIKQRIVYVGSIWWYTLPGYTGEGKIEGKQGGYCFDFSARYHLAQTDEEQKVLDELTEFWSMESNSAKLAAKVKDHKSTGFLVGNDLDKLVKVGIPGLISEVNAMPDSSFKTGLQIVLEAVTDVCRYYQKQAEEKGFNDIAKNLSAIIEREPESVAEALQLILLFELFTHERHYEINRLDVALGDIYVKEIEHNTITEEQAIDLIQGFFKMINVNGEPGVCRLVIGGRGRRNVENADRFIEAALKAEQKHKQVTPQMTLRIYEGMNPDLLTLAYDTISETYTYPLLYNDDPIIPGIAEAFGVSIKEAEDYYPLGCGEIVLAPHSPAILVRNWNVAKMVNDAIREKGISSYDDLYHAFMKQIEFEAKDIAILHNKVIEVNNSQNAFLMSSLLTNNCLKRGKPILDGGAVYNGACVMGHGYTNAANALLALKNVVFEKRLYTLEEVIVALGANFVGYEDIQKALLDNPKFGNDNPEVDLTLFKLWRDISTATKKVGEVYGFDFHTVSSVNPGGYMMGLATEATADGRLSGVPFAIGNAPVAGTDTSGLTALMNSVLTTDPVNGGIVTNFKISKEFFTSAREKFEALFGAFWSSGGLQANITIINKGDLEAALEKPEDYTHIMVRLGGWTARYVELEKHIQKEILERTLY